MNEELKYIYLTTLSNLHQLAAKQYHDLYAADNDGVSFKTRLEINETNKLIAVLLKFNIV
jgi:hypothetical protein